MDRQGQKIIAIDPASVKCGVAIFEGSALQGTVTLVSKMKDPLARRLDVLHQLSDLIATADIVISEEPMLLGRNNKGMERLLGYIELMTAGTVHFLHPSTVKSFIGDMSKDKKAIAEKLMPLFPDEQWLIKGLIKNEAWDETDAIAIAATWFYKTGHAAFQKEEKPKKAKVKKS